MVWPGVMKISFTSEAEVFILPVTNLHTGKSTGSCQDIRLRLRIYREARTSLQFSPRAL